MTDRLSTLYMGVLLGWGCSVVAQGWWRQRLGEPLTE